MNKAEIHNYYQTMVSRKVVDLKSDLSRDITRIERESSANGRFMSGGFCKMIVDAHLGTLDKVMKMIFDEARTITLEFDIEFDEGFKEIMVALLDDYFNGMSNKALLERYFGRFGQVSLDMLNNCGWDHDLSLVQCWYLNNIEPFTFKLRNEVKRMKESQKGTVINHFQGNGNTITTVIGSDNSVNIEFMQKGTDAIAALDAMIEYMRNDAASEDKDDIISSIEEVKKELQSDKPNKFKMKSLMTPIVALLEHADKIAPAIDVIKSIL